MSVLRTGAGGLTWLHPRLSHRLFRVGLDAEYTAGTGLMGRLFGVRDLGLALAVRHPDLAVRRAALQAGLIVDLADVVATAIAVRRGAPASALLGVAAGAALFASLGAAGLARS